MNDRHAAYRVVRLESQLLRAGGEELPVLARIADNEARCSVLLRGANILQEGCTMPATQCLNCRVCHTCCCGCGSSSNAKAMTRILVLAQANGVQYNPNLVNELLFCQSFALGIDKKWTWVIAAGLDIVENSGDWAEWGVRTAHDNVCSRPKLITFGHFQVELYHTGIGVVVYCDVSPC